MHRLSQLRRAPRLVLLAVAGGLTATTLAVAPPSGAAAAYPTSGPCLGTSGTTCHYQYGVVVFDGQAGDAGVDDGDTVDVRMLGSSATVGIRFTGINAMEMHQYSSDPAKWRGECHAIPATRVVYDAVRSSTYDGQRYVVRLASVGTNPTSGKRLRRAVATWNGSSWVDLGTVLMSKGLAILDANSGEYAWNRPYNLLAQQAASQHIGLFDTTACGSGPAQSAPLKVFVKTDADGVDGRNVNGEWAKVYNAGGSDVNLSHWWLRDSYYRGTYAHGYTFPAGTVVKAHSWIRLHAGCGTHSGRDYYWCPNGSGSPTSIWDNYDGGPKYMGDGGYLFDPDGDLRAWMTYPCLVSCRDPLAGKLAVSVNPKGATTEYVDIKNISSSRVSLFGHQLFQNPDYYDFNRGDVLKPGQKLRLFMQARNSAQHRGTAAIVRYWGEKPYQLTDGGDYVSVVNYRTTVVVCKHWGSKRACR